MENRPKPLKVLAAEASIILLKKLITKTKESLLLCQLIQNSAMISIGNCIRDLRNRPLRPVFQSGASKKMQTKLSAKMHDSGLKIESNNSNSCYYLEKILKDKLLENSRLKDSNEKLLLEVQLKKEQTKKLSGFLSDVDSSERNKAVLQELKEKVMNYQVEIQKLKQQLELAIKKKDKAIKTNT
ncbi:hypothetical protein AVEN_13276-1 [Araneus ventricosus]|uniref:Uncharacterized protein n=1 Tax=Araneus ventricosus TaxID=182803 RepID=A0A4Y2EUJ8_ARAVE|nr:hypothetical protein AVEN_13276-1 [Araneus ventricosus]